MCGVGNVVERRERDCVAHVIGVWRFFNMGGGICGVGNSSSCVVGWLSVGGVVVGWVCLCDMGVRRMLK